MNRYALRCIQSLNCNPPFSDFSLNPDGILMWLGRDDMLVPLPTGLLSPTSNGKVNVELIAMAEDEEERRGFVRIIVKLPLPKHQVSLSIIFAIACFLFFVTNLVLLTVIFGKKLSSS